jgi:hypothetical protein
MPDEKKPDPFKPQPPAIPGVQPREVKAATEPPPATQIAGPPPQKSSSPAKLIAIVGVSAFVIFIALLFWIRGSSSKPAPEAAEAAPPVVAPAPEPKAAPAELVGPGPIATTADLDKPWSSKRFLMRNSIGGRTESAMVVRLPGGSYWGFSLVEPFGNCELEYVTDVGKLRTQYHFHAEHPMVADPCNNTVYDLLGYGGGAANDQLVRGVIVQGSGIRPPMAIEIKVEGKQVVAVREE